MQWDVDPGNDAAARVRCMEPVRSHRIDTTRGAFTQHRSASVKGLMPISPAHVANIEHLAASSKTSTMAGPGVVVATP
jgi:hypothetical protein